jgi:uncharacterized protein (TIGR03083 family)
VIDYSGVDVGVAYRDTRDRIIDVVSGCSTSQWEQVVPHCPAWTVRQTLAHLAGVADDGINGNMEGVTTEPWTAAQVNKRALVSGPEIIDEWKFSGPFIDARATEVGLTLAQLLFDTVAHEHDLRFALGMPGGRDSEGMLVALAFVNRILPPRAAEDGINLQVLVDDPRGGPGVVHAMPTFASAATLRPLTLRTTLFDLIRMSGSRRSLAQIHAMDWSDDPAPIIAMLPFALPPQPIEE